MIITRKISALNKLQIFERFQLIFIKFYSEFVKKVYDFSFRQITEYIYLC